MLTPVGEIRRYSQMNLIFLLLLLLLLLHVMLNVLAGMSTDIGVSRDKLRPIRP